MRLDRKVVVVTGGAGGIGRAAVERLVSEGARVAVLDRDQGGLEAVRAELGDRVVTMHGDVTDLDDLSHVFSDTRAQIGTIDGVVVNAAAERLQPIDEVMPEDFDERIALLLKSYYFTVQKALPHLSGTASVVLVGSSAAMQGLPNNSLYQACKAAVRSLARGLSADLVQRGIRVNTLSPGLTDTGIGDAVDLSDPESRAAKLFEAEMPKITLGRLAHPAEIAAGIAFLVSDDSSYMLGSDLVIDGGSTQL